MMNEMIPLTVANTLNQTAKNRIEARSDQSLKQAIQNQNLAPKGQFDIYDQNGKVISNATVSEFRDRTVYVGVAKVAGGGIPRERLKELKIEYPHFDRSSNILHERSFQMIRVRFPPMDIQGWILGHRNLLPKRFIFIDACVRHQLSRNHKKSTSFALCQTSISKLWKGGWERSNSKLKPRRLDGFVMDKSYLT